MQPEAPSSLPAALRSAAAAAARGATALARPPPLPPPATATATACCSELSGVSIGREPTEEDYRYLAGRAGFVLAPDGAKAASSASLEELAAFKAWFGG